MQMTQEDRNAMNLPCKGADVVDFRLDCTATTGTEQGVTWFGAEGDTYCFNCALRLEDMQLALPLALPTRAQLVAAREDVNWN